MSESGRHHGGEHLGPDMDFDTEFAKMVAGFELGPGTEEPEDGAEGVVDKSDVADAETLQIFRGNLEEHITRSGLRHPLHELDPSDNYTIGKVIVDREFYPEIFVGALERYDEIDVRMQLTGEPGAFKFDLGSLDIRDEHGGVDQFDLPRDGTVAYSRVESDVGYAVKDTVPTPDQLALAMGAMLAIEGVKDVRRHGEY